MASPGKTGTEYKSTDQERDNRSHDDLYGVNVVEVVAENGGALHRLKVDGDGALVTSATLSGDVAAATEYTDGASTPANPVGGIPVFDDAGTITAVSNTNPLPVSASIDTTGLATDATDTSTAAISTSIGAKNDTSATTDTGTFSLISLFKRLLEKVTTLVAKDFSTETTLSALNTKVPASPATTAKQDTGNTSLSSIDSKITAVNTGAVVVSSSALPSGAATAAKQPALGTAGTSSADVITVQGRASMTPLVTDGSGVTQPVSNSGLTELAAAINSSKVDVNIVSSDVATGGTSAADDADFTAGTTLGTPSMGVFESTPTTVTDGDLGTVGITAGRRLKTSATIDSALPAGTNNIGDVDVLSLPALPAGNNNIGDVDVASSALPTGAATSAKQDSLLTELQLKADLTETQPVSLASVPSHAVTNAGTFAVQSTNQTGDNTIGRVKLTDGTDVADILDLANSNPLATAIVDANGDQISSFGGGTQYSDADANADPTGTVAMGTDGTSVYALHTDTAGDLQVDVLSSALPSGAATSAKQDTLIGHVDGVETLIGTTNTTLGTIDADTGNISTKIDTVAGAVSGSEMQVDVVTSALPSGAATSAKQDTQITAEQAIQASVELIDDTVRAEDVASADGHKGVVQMAVRQDTPANTSNTDGDYEIPKMSGGRMWVDASGKTLTVDGSGVTQPVSGTFWQATQPVSGTVTANAGTNLNTSALALAATQTDKSQFTKITDGTDTALVTASGEQNVLETNSGAIKTAVEIIDNAISGNEMQVDVVAALPAGTNNIGDVDIASIAAGDNNIGNVDVVTLPALPAGSNAIGKLAANSGVDIGDVDVTSAVSATMDHGSNRDIDTTAEQITSTSFAAKFGVTLKADISNTGILYIGNSDVTAGTTAATDGIPLSAGESITLPVTNSNIPYAIASANNQIIYWVAV